MSRALIVAGAPASGKTVYAAALAKKLDYLVFDLDDQLPDFIEKGHTRLEEVGMEKFLAEIRDARYRDLVERGMHALKEGKSVILVAPFSKETSNIEIWGELSGAFLEFGVQPKLIWVRIAREKIRERMLSRAEIRDREKVSSEAAFDEYMQSTSYQFPVVPYLEVRGDLPFESQLDVLSRFAML